MSLIQAECKETHAAEFKKNQSKQNTGCKKVCVITNGCPENRIDCSKIQKFVGDNGHTIIAEVKDADIVVFNACGLTESTQKESIEIIKFIQTQKKSSAELVVCGCLPRINMPRLREVHQGFTFEHKIEQLNEILDIQTDSEDICANHLSPRTHAPATRRWHVTDLKR